MFEIIYQTVEIFNSLYDGISLAWAAQTYTVIYILFLLAFYVFKSVCLMILAKNNKIKQLWLCYIPFANFYVIGKIIGACKIFGIKIKNIGLLVGILLGIFTVTSAIYDVNVFGERFLFLFLHGQLNAVEIETTVFDRVIEIINLVGRFVLMFFMACFIMTFAMRLDRKNAIFVCLILAFCILPADSKSAVTSYYFTFLPVFAITLFIQRKKRPLSINDYYRYATQNNGARSHPNNYYNPNMNKPQNPEAEPFSEYNDVKKPPLNQDIFTDF